MQLCKTPSPWYWAAAQLSVHEAVGSPKKVPSSTLKKACVKIILSVDVIIAMVADIGMLGSRSLKDFEKASYSCLRSNC